MCRRCCSRSGALLVGDLAGRTSSGVASRRRRRRRSSPRSRPRSSSCPTTWRSSRLTSPGRCAAATSVAACRPPSAERRTNEILSKVSSKGEFVEQCLRLDNLPRSPVLETDAAPEPRRRRAARPGRTAGVAARRSPRCKATVVLDTRRRGVRRGPHPEGAERRRGRGPTWAGTVLDEARPSCWCWIRRRISGP